jgi:hypothetical protein
VPKHGSWLNLIEGFFSKFAREGKVEAAWRPGVEPGSGFPRNVCGCDRLSPSCHDAAPRSINHKRGIRQQITRSMISFMESIV